MFGYESNQLRLGTWNQFIRSFDCIPPVYHYYLNPGVILSAAKSPQSASHRIVRNSIGKVSALREFGHIHFDRSLVHVIHSYTGGGALANADSRLGAARFNVARCNVIIKLIKVPWWTSEPLTAVGIVWWTGGRLIRSAAAGRKPSELRWFARGLRHLRPPVQRGRGSARGSTELCTWFYGTWYEVLCDFVRGS